MQIWPAIDLRGGRCVRLQQGDYSLETVFSDDPVAMAHSFVEQGAQYLHLVDLDGARDPEVTNRQVIANIINAVDIPCELGGGIRDEKAIEELLVCGLARLVLGTSAIRDQAWFRKMCRKYPAKLVLGIDARDGMVATDGWLETSDCSAVALAQQFAHEPLAAIIYTDIATDGMLTGPNTAAMAEMQQAVDLPVVASGGISCADDVSQLAKIPMAGCIIGRALYEGKLMLADAIRAASQSS